MSTTKPLVVVSKSEPQDAVAKLGSFGLDAQWGEVGSDYCFWPHGQSWAIERKTVSNLLGSLKDRQLVEQTHRGADAFDRYIILIEGEYKRTPNGVLAYYSPRDPRAGADGFVVSGWQFSAISGMLFALQQIGDRQNVMVHHWPVLYDSASAIASIISATCSEQGSKFTSERQRPDLPPSAALGGKLYGDAIWSLCALPGCGPEVAMAVLHTAGTLQSAMSLLANVNASKEIRVNGKKLGERRAERLKEAVLAHF